MRLCQDVSSAQWIVDRIHGLGKDVGSVIPDGFAGYLRLFHPAGRIGGETEELVRWAEIATANGRTVHPEMQWPNISGVLEHTGSPQPALWNHEPDVGSLPQDRALRLAELLATHTTTPDRVWFCVWNGWGALKVHGYKPQILNSIPSRWPRLWRPGRRFQRRQVPPAPTIRLPGRDYYLFEGPIAAITESAEYSPGFQSANLWWPDDRAWCVATEIDFSWSYLGGTTNCTQDIANSGEFEGLPSRLDHGITHASDKQNPAPTAR